MDMEITTGNLGRPSVVFDEREVAQLLRAAVERDGGQTAFAKRRGADRTRINRVLSGKERAGDAIAKALGLRKVYVAE
jgi:DNA-binding phage protein